VERRSRKSLKRWFKLIEEQIGDMRCAVLLADSAQQKLRFASAPNIPRITRQA